MIEHDSTISTLTSDVHLNFLNKMLSFRLQVTPGNILLPNNVLKFKLKVRPELNILGDRCFKPSITLPKHLCCCCNTSLINLHYHWTQGYFFSIEALRKGFSNTLVIPLQFLTIPIATCFFKHLVNLRMRFQI